MIVRGDNRTGASIFAAGTLADIPGMFRRNAPQDSRGNFELCCQEFALCALYGNLRMGKLSAMLDALGISSPPNMLYLVEVEGFRDMRSRYPDSDIRIRTSQAALCVHDELRIEGIDAVVSRLEGSDLVAVFVRIDGRSIMDQVDRLHVEKLARVISRSAAIGAGCAVSVGFGDFCQTFARFPAAFSEAQSALDACFRVGSGSICAFERVKKPTAPRLDGFRRAFTRLVSAIDQSDEEVFFDVADEVVEILRDSGFTPAGLRILIAGFCNRIADYYIAAGFEDAEALPIAHELSLSALNMSSVTDAREILIEASRRYNGLFTVAMQSIDVRFKQSVVDCIEKHSANQTFSLNYLASLNSYSPSYFSRLFSKVFGVPFSRYLTEYRVEKAKKLLLQETLLLSDIAAKTGFRSASYFCAVFKNETGMSPRQYALSQRSEARESPLENAPEEDWEDGREPARERESVRRTANHAAAREQSRRTSRRGTVKYAPPPKPVAAQRSATKKNGDAVRASTEPTGEDIEPV